MAANIPTDMLPHMDWNAEDKLAAWTFYKERLEQYFIIPHTAKQDNVTHIVCFVGKEASERWIALKDQLSEENQKDADEVFKAFASSFEKSSSHWQVRDEYLADIKQGKQQTIAELDSTPPKTTGEHSINTFAYDALRGNGNEEYSLNNKCKACTYTDSDSKTDHQ